MRNIQKIPTRKLSETENTSIPHGKYSEIGLAFGEQLVNGSDFDSVLSGIPEQSEVEAGTK